MMESQKTFIESCWEGVPEYALGEMTHDAAHSLCIQRLTKGEAVNIIACIKHSVMVSIHWGQTPIYPGG